VSYRGQADPASGRRLFRTGCVQPIRISPINRPGDVATVGMSLRDPTIKYELGKWMNAHVDSTAAKGPGIHFFLDEADAKMWPVLFKR
jgi:hypothetical protein